MIWEMLYCILFFVVPVAGMFTVISVKSLKCKNAVEIDDSEVCEVLEKKVINGTAYIDIANLMRKSVCNSYYGKMRPCGKSAQGIVIDLKNYRRKKKQKGRAYSRDGPYNTS